jgi:hypothetical protein
LATLVAAPAQAYPVTVPTTLHLHAGPSAAAPVIGRLPQGARVEVAGCERRWCRVRWRGRAGWVQADYVEPRAPFPPRQVAPPPYAAPPALERRGPPPGVCDERAATWSIGRPATQETVARARRQAGARNVRVLRPGEAHTQEFRRDRLNLELDRRGRIRDVRCG